MRRLTVVLGLLFGTLLLVPTAASAATAIEYGLIAAESPTTWPWD